MREEILQEEQLYEPTRRFLMLSFPERAGRKFGDANVKPHVDVIARAGESGAGRWTRPDLAALFITRGTYVPYWRAELHSFEVKTAKGCDETAVHEAHAHSRQSQFAWLVFQSVGKASAGGAKFRRVVELSTELGIGVIHFEDTESPQTWSIAQWPRRTATDEALADRFVMDRFSEATRSTIARQLADMGWSP